MDIIAAIDDIVTYVFELVRLFVIWIVIAPPFFPEISGVAVEFLILDIVSSVNPIISVHACNVLEIG